MGNLYNEALRILTGRTLTVKQIRDAYTKNKHVLKAVESGCCPGTEHLIVMNDGVLLRYMLLELGFTDEEIKREY